MKANGKKITLLCGTALMAVGLASCGKKSDDPAGPTKLTVCLASEPQSIDPALNSSVDGATMLVHLDSGLYRYKQQADGSLKLEYDLAKNITKESKAVVNHEENADGEFVEVNYANGVRYTVELRDDIKFSDGTPIKADDFIYSWNRASGASLGADYGYMFEAIVDGYAHECDDEAFPTIGIAKVNDTKFTVDLMVDVPYLDQLFAFPTYFPVKKSTVDAADEGHEPGTWATDPSTFVSCGAYKLDSWEHNSYIKLKKNADYWDAANVKVDEITFALSDDDAAILASYQSGEYDMIDSVPNEQIDDLKAAYPDEFTIAGQMGTYYVSFNVNSTVFTKADTEAKKEKVRKALGLFIDREYIVKEIGKAGQVPANAFVSAGLSDPAGGEFVDHNGAAGDGTGYYNKGETAAAYQANVAEAIALLKEVGYTYDETTKKFTDFPTFKYLYNTSSGHKAIAENLRDTWKNFGITATLENQDWSQFLTARKAGQFDVARNGWIADYDDPSSYLTMWTTASGNNDCQFGKGAHAEVAIYSADLNRDGAIGDDEKNLTWAQSYDKLVDMSNKESDPAKRFALLHEIETLLMSTGAICPVYYYTDIYMLKSNVKGFFSSPLGYKFFMYCEVTK